MASLSGDDVVCNLQVSRLEPPELLPKIPSLCMVNIFLTFLLGSLQYTANGLASVTTPKTASSPIHLRASHDMPATSKLPLLNLDGPPPDISDPGECQFTKR